MLPRELRVNSRAEFTTVTRRGRKASCGSVVVYRHVDPESTPSRGGLIVGRSVGNAVVRHRVSRRLRAILAEVLPDRSGELIVVRALPASAVQEFGDLRSQVLRALSDAMRRGGRAAGPASREHLGQDPVTVAAGSQ